MDYIKRYLGVPNGTDIDALKAENELLKKTVEDFKQKLKAVEDKGGDE